MKLLKFFLILSLYILVSSCGTVKEAFTNQKKNSSDEFLVEKKSPLVMPPDYNDLPVPNTQNNVEENSKNIESLITNNEKGDKKDNNSKGSDQNLEKTLLNKIKKN
jgi:hypothetical protein